MKNEDYYIGKGKLYLGEKKQMKLKWYDYILAGFIVFWFIVKNRFNFKRANQEIYILGLKQKKKLKDEFVYGKERLKYYDKFYNDN